MAKSEEWQPIPLEEMDALAAGIREQIGDCPKCGGPGDGACCDHE